MFTLLEEKDVGNWPFHSLSKIIGKTVFTTSPLVCILYYELNQIYLMGDIYLVGEVS